VVNLYPFHYDGLLIFGWANFRIGKLRETEKIFDKVLLLNPGDESALEGLSLIE